MGLLVFVLYHKRMNQSFFVFWLSSSYRRDGQKCDRLLGSFWVVGDDDGGVAGVDYDRFVLC